MKSIVRIDGKTGETIEKPIEFTEEELDRAIEIWNTLHHKGFGCGSTDKELDIINSDAVIIIGKGKYGDLYGKVER